MFIELELSFRLDKLISSLFDQSFIEPGDENALLRHVVYITGLPKEIQNETLAEVFGAACGQIAPVGERTIER